VTDKTVVGTQKNVNNTMMKNLLDACAAALAFYSFGYGIAYGSSRSSSVTYVGTNNFFLRGDVSFAEVFLRYSFSTASVTIVAGTLAERCTMTAYLFYAFILSGFVYPVVVHAVWTNSGVLTNMFGTSFLDFAGAGVVHMTGGMTALIASLILGPRNGRFYEVNGKPCVGLVTGHSVSLQLLGTLILWVGWYGFNVGSTLSLTVSTQDKALVAGLTAVNTTLSGACGCLSALLTKGAWFLYKEGEFPLDIVAAMNGALSGLVAITGGCGVVEPASSIPIGIVAGWLYLGTKHLLESCKVDDAVDAIPVHLANGMWGLLSTGLLASPNRLLAASGEGTNPGWLYSLSNCSLLAAQIVGMIAITTWVTVTMFPLFKLLDKGGSFRVSEVDELIGLGKLKWTGQFFTMDLSLCRFQTPRTTDARYQRACLMTNPAIQERTSAWRHTNNGFRLSCSAVEMTKR
jgi:ammonium transporter, Amt family